MRMRWTSASAFALLSLATPVRAAQPAQQTQPPIVAWTYVVRAGDTFATIAQRMGVPMAALAAENHIPLPYLITEGQVLRRPSTTPMPIPASSPVPRPVPPRSAPPSRPMPAPRPAPRPLPANRPEAGAPRLSWPTSGAIAVRFGELVNRRPNNGVDLAALPGTMVHAAAAGRVAFAGTEPERFGQLIVIDHGGGWVTAYAYLGKVEVREGQQVAARQSIARIGRSGEARKPTLHFELRRNNVPRDPAPYLPVRF
ncbi:M23 family metallopeptidase [Novosphingobium sp.]|uniref:M23 family metallopeptidase n=1 Tax=Novosphingobium sp. TaxID=1874826 RepID=UPI002FDD0E90